MNQFSKKTLRAHSNRAAKSYNRAAVVEREIADRLLSRLDLMKINPLRILNCGARTGYSTRLLRQRYKKARVIGCDLSESMLRQTPKPLFLKYKNLVCADYEALPFQSRSFDLIFSNLALAWTNDIHVMLQEFYRLLTPNGLLLFTSAGPDTLKELRALSDVHDFIDMHDIGDALVLAKFLDPVMDMEYLTLRYDSVKSLAAELNATGVTNARSDRARGLGGRKRRQALLEDYPAESDGKVTATLELVYGHAWMPEKLDLGVINQAGEVVVPVPEIKSSPKD